MDNLWIFCADIGSTTKEKFGWYGTTLNRKKSASGKSIQDFVQKISDELTLGNKVAIGFECPLYIPVREEPERLTEARKGEGNRSWSASAGCVALATGIVEVAWILKGIKAKTHDRIEAFLDWHCFEKAPAGIFLWEAFVSGQAKGTQDIHDAQIAVDAFLKVQNDPVAANLLKEEDSVISLIGASLLWADWEKDIQVLHKPCLVIGPRSEGTTRRN